MRTRIIVIGRDTNGQLQIRRMFARTWPAYAANLHTILRAFTNGAIDRSEAAAALVAIGYKPEHFNLLLDTLWPSGFIRLFG